MKNPRHIKIKPDDTMWFHTGDVGDIAAIVSDADRWHKDNIEKNVPDCAPAIKHTFKFKAVNSTHRRVLISGICNTGPISIRGALGPTLRALEARRELTQIREQADLLRKPTIAEVDQYMTAKQALSFHSVELRSIKLPEEALTDSFWENLDDEILRAAPKSGIEFFYLPAEGIGYIHFELGNDPLLIAGYVQAVPIDQDNYLAWLLGKINPKMTRKAYVIDEEGNPTEIDISEVKLSINKGIGILTPDIWKERILCPLGCDIFACNIDSGTLDGMEIVLDDVTVKYYCRRADGTTCSPLSRESNAALSASTCTCNSG
ncbi:MAG: hypothetical protein KF784_00350 [Fimbriimonadaceae bacterium]|nr:hypothetical protein [Fimbriimonadaceae bacterium]